MTATGFEWLLQDPSIARHNHTRDSVAFLIRMWRGTATAAQFERDRSVYVLHPDDPLLRSLPDGTQIVLQRGATPTATVPPGTKRQRATKSEPTECPQEEPREAQEGARS
jgi:hypothetical protein